MSLVCMLALPKRTGYRVDELSTAERGDAAQWSAEDKPGNPEQAGEGGTPKPVA